MFGTVGGPVKAWARIIARLWYGIGKERIATSPNVRSEEQR